MKSPEEGFSREGFGNRDLPLEPMAGQSSKSSSSQPSFVQIYTGANQNGNNLWPKPSFQPVAAPGQQQKLWYHLSEDENWSSVTARAARQGCSSSKQKEELKSTLQLSCHLATTFPAAHHRGVRRAAQSQALSRRAAGAPAAPSHPVAPSTPDWAHIALASLNSLLAPARISWCWSRETGGH